MNVWLLPVTYWILQPVVKYFISAPKCKGLHLLSRGYGPPKKASEANAPASLSDLVRVERRGQPDTELPQQDGGREHIVHRAARPDARAVPGGGGSSDQGGRWNPQPARVHPHQ